jgi:spore coat protein U-like protein
MPYFALMLRRTTQAAPALLAALAICMTGARAHAMGCTILDVSSVRFGAYDVFDAAPLDSTGLVAFRCSSVATGDVVSIQLNRGGSSTFFPRAMTRRGMRFEYNLFLDAARTIVWGDGTSGTASYTVHPAEGQPISVPIYGRITPRQNVEAGAYNDVVVLTVNY